MIRGDFQAPSIYKLDASSPDALLLATSFQMKPRDVVFVSTYELSRFNRVVTQILPTVQAIWQTYDIIFRAARFSSFVRCFSRRLTSFCLFWNVALCRPAMVAPFELR